VDSKQLSGRIAYAPYLRGNRFFLCGATPCHWARNELIIASWLRHIRSCRSFIGFPFHPGLAGCCSLRWRRRSSSAPSASSIHSAQRAERESGKSARHAAGRLHRGNLLEMLRRAELYCSCGTLLGLVGQWIIVDRHTPSQLTAMIFRSALFIAAAIWCFTIGRGFPPSVAMPRALYRPRRRARGRQPRQGTLRQPAPPKRHLALRPRLPVAGIILFSANISPAHWWH